jgi:uncharacterized membrane protein YqjE
MTMDFFREYFAFLLPLLLIQFALMITALVHILKHDTYKAGNRVLWIVMVLFVNIIGPILYFTVGRSDD